MNAKQNGNKAAYARPASLDNSGSTHEDGDRHITETEGLTKREAFAMAAMQAAFNFEDNRSYEEMAQRCVVLADALLAELAKEEA